MDWTSIIVGGLALVGTTTGSILGIRQSNKVVDLRISALEKKMDKHNCLMERMGVAENSIKVAHHRLDDMEGALPRAAGK